MAELSVNGLEGFALDLQGVMELPDSVAEQMLEAEAKVIEDAQVFTGMKMGVHRTGVTLSSITHGKLKRGRDGSKNMHVYPRGVNERGDRNAEVAFINEYGAPQRGIPPRPFIRTANEDAADAAVDAAEKVHDAFLKSKNL